MRIKLKPLKLHDGQKEIIRHPARFKVIRAGRRFGKTKLALYWLTCSDINSVIQSGKPVGYFVPRYKDLSPVWDQTIRIFNNIIKKANYTEKRIQFINDGIMDFWSLEQNNAGRGYKYTKVVIDEAAHSPYLKQMWEQCVRPTLTDYRGEAWFISTPYQMNYFYEINSNDGKQGFEDWKSFHMPTSRNPFIDPGELEQARKSLPELVYMQEYEAEFVTFGAGLVKPDYVIEGEPRLNFPTVFGVDLAISTKDTADYTAVVVMSRDPMSGIIHIIDVHRFRLGFHDTLQKIKLLAKIHNPTVIAIEQTQYQAAAIQELARTSLLPVRGVRPDRDKISRFIPLLTKYEQKLIRHSPGLPDWFKEEITSFPEGRHDDLVDAASYAYMSLPNTSPSEFRFVGKDNKW